MKNDDVPDEKAVTPPTRVILASRWLNGVAVGKVEVVASTKHGATSMIGVKPPAKLEVGEALVMDAWVLGSRNFVVIGPHDKPMKLPGNWFVVQNTKPKVS